MNDDRLPAQRGGAKALLLTVLGEFVLPAGGSAWTASLLEAAGALGIGEKNARQALSRIADDGLIESSRHGRQVRWTLTPAGRSLLESGTERIYSFGRSADRADAWGGEWLVVHCPVAEERRAARNRLRTQLAFLGFGELSPNLFVSPHVERDASMRSILTELEVLATATVLRSRTPGTGDDTALAARAWDLDQLAADYGAFSELHRGVRPVGDADSFTALVELVHDWRRFPFVDPELPPELLPTDWAGATAVDDFHELHDRWSPAARSWLAERS